MAVTRFVVRKSPQKVNSSVQFVQFNQCSSFLGCAKKFSTDMASLIAWAPCWFSKQLRIVFFCIFLYSIFIPGYG